MRMHTAIADEAEEVQALAFRFLEGLDEHGHLREFAIADALVDASEVLIDDAARAEVQVTDFAVAHLAFGQPHVLAAGADGAARIRGIKMIMERRLREQRGIAVGLSLSFTAGIDAPAVADDENNRFFRHGCAFMRQAGGVVKVTKHPTGPESVILGRGQLATSQSARIVRRCPKSPPFKNSRALPAGLKLSGIPPRKLSFAPTAASSRLRSSKRTAPSSRSAICWPRCAKSPTTNAAGPPRAKR